MAFFFFSQIRAWPLEAAARDICHLPLLSRRSECGVHGTAVPQQHHPPHPRLPCCSNPLSPYLPYSLANPTQNHCHSQHCRASRPNPSTTIPIFSLALFNPPHSLWPTTTTTTPPPLQYSNPPSSHLSHFGPLLKCPPPLLYFIHCLKWARHCGNSKTKPNPTITTITNANTTIMLF